MTKTEIKHLAIYIRISDEKKVYGKRVDAEETLKNHYEILTTYAERNKYTYEVFQEVVSGGKDELNQRPELEKLLERLEEFDAILVTELSRLSRDSYISAVVQKYVKKYRKLILTPESCYDLNNESDALMYNVGSAVSSHERMVIGKRIKNNKLQLARMGLNASGSVPLGYKRNPQTKKLEIDEENAEIVRYAFKLFSDGYGASKITQALNDIGYRTLKGGRFKIQTVKDMLCRETYKGVTVYHDFDYQMKKDEKTGEMKTVRKIKETIKIENTHPSIIEPELFDSLITEREKRAEHYSGGREKPSKKATPSLLKDLLYCSYCGRKVRISYDPTKDYNIIRNCADLLPDGSKCLNSGFIVSNVETDVINRLIQYQNELESEIRQLEEGNTDDLMEERKSLLKALNKQLNQLDEEMKGILKLELKYEMQGETNPIQEEFIREEKQNNIDTRIKIQNKLDELAKKMNKPSLQDEIEKRKHVIDIIDELDDKTPEQINELLKRLIKKIYYKRIIPDDIKKLGAKNPIRKYYPADIEIEYYD